MENSHVTLQVPQNIIDCFACSDGKYLYSIINWQPEKLIKNISNFASLYQHIVLKNPGYSMIYCGRFREILGCIFGWRHQVHNPDTESLIASETRRKHIWFCNHLRVCLYGLAPSGVITWWCQAITTHGDDYLQTQLWQGTKSVHCRFTLRLRRPSFTKADIFSNDIFTELPQRYPPKQNVHVDARRITQLL